MGYARRIRADAGHLLKCSLSARECRSRMGYVAEISCPSPVPDQDAPWRSLVAEHPVGFERQRHQLWWTSELDTLALEVIPGNSPTLR